MGALLLRGYRMLGSSCPQCGTVLLQDKEQRLLCVSCQDPEGGHGTGWEFGGKRGNLGNWGIWGEKGKFGGRKLGNLGVGNWGF
uniref:Uncharacterized protein n=1 Tax=Geospiza parvula TaxID=87175 RepID=A0A8U8AW10_GEOPR